MKVCIELLLDWHPRDWPPLKIDLNDCHEEITASSSQIPSNPSKFLEKGCINKKKASVIFLVGLFLPFALTECLIKVIKRRLVKEMFHYAGRIVDSFHHLLFL